MNQKVQQAIENFKKYSDKPLEAVKDAVTHNLCTITDSTISYFATINAAQDTLSMTGWSKSAMMNCRTIDKPIVYQLVDTGLWGDAVRERKAVITNDYNGLKKPTKKGYPEGHVNVKRHMNLPVYEGGKVVLVAGVGNKKEEYTMEDARDVEAFMNEAWKILKGKL